jgi:hypothetical protein
MASIWQDLLGTTKSFFRIGFTGPRLKNVSGNLSIRNPGDSADAEVTTSKLNVSGNGFDLNSDAAGSGADWKYTVQRPSSGMSAVVTLTLPPTDGSPGQVLGNPNGDGVLDWVNAASTDADDKIDTTTLAFDSTSPVSMFTLPANAIIEKIQVVIDEAFDGTPTASVGISGTVSKYLASTDIDLTQAAGTVIEVHPGVEAPGGTEALIITYAANSASAGSARFLVFYAIPS